MQPHIIVNETCTTIRYLGRQALKDHWVTASLAVLIYSACMEVPPIFIDALFGTTTNPAVVFSGGVDPAITAALAKAMSEAGYSSVFSSIYTLLVAGPFSFGISFFFINLVRRQPIDYGQLFTGFSYYGRTLGLSVLIALISVGFMIPSFILMTLGALIGSFFLVMLGVFALFLVIIPAIMLSMSFFLMVDNVEIGIIGAIVVSWQLMRGNAGKYFLLNLSFIGWIIIGTLIATVIAIIFAVGQIPFVMAIGSFVAQVGMFVVIAYMYAAQVQFYDLLTGKLRLSNPGQPMGGY